MTSEWKCGDCGHEFEFEEFSKLNHVPVDPENLKYGYHPVCECGYEFHRDKWRKQDIVKFKKYSSWLQHLFDVITLGQVVRPQTIRVAVSTVFLELNHGKTLDEGDLWYETMIFDKGCDLLPCVTVDYCDRYETKEQAEKGHQEVLDRMKRKETEFFLFKWG